MLDWADLCEADWEELCTSDAIQESVASSHASEAGLTSSDPEADEHKLVDSEERKAGYIPRSPRRKKGREKESDNNAALDPIRYKTKMCKNWQQFGKCPYGPRCLFAHGPRDMRSCSSNIDVITTASLCDKPEETFYNQGRFPSFMPLPNLKMETNIEANTISQGYPMEVMHIGETHPCFQVSETGSEFNIGFQTIAHAVPSGYLPNAQWVELPATACSQLGYPNPSPEWPTVPLSAPFWLPPIVGQGDWCSGLPECLPMQVPAMPFPGPYPAWVQ